MSTAGRPTYHAAIGHANTSTFRSRHMAGRDQTAHTQLKFRQPGQATTQEIKQKNFRAELEAKENKYLLEKDKTTAWLAKEEEKVDVKLLLKNQPEIDIEKIQSKYDDRDVDVDYEEEEDDADVDSAKKNDFDSSRYVYAGKYMSFNRTYLEELLRVFVLITVTKMTTKMTMKKSYRLSWSESERSVQWL